MTRLRAALEAVSRSLAAAAAGGQAPAPRPAAPSGASPEER
ncbi:hypothetical protein [Muricoccus roseus]|nr:hypothetical protein [Roseomonas rosea]